LYRSNVFLKEKGHFFAENWQKIAKTSDHNIDPCTWFIVFSMSFSGTIDWMLGSGLPVGLADTTTI
jgi:hypothetical protein